jgi:hypothetical protein
MTGLLLILFLGFSILFFIISLIDTYNDDGWKTGSFICLLITLVLVIAIPISRIDSKTNVEYIKSVQQTIDANRLNQQELNVLERTAVITEINECNDKIITWRVKGQKWYNNKWYYDKSTQGLELIK